MGFLSLPDCEIRVLSNDEETLPEIKQTETRQNNKWVDLNYLQPQELNDEASFCSHCQLVISSNKQNENYLCGSLPRFDGTISDRNQRCKVCKRKKTDAFLFLGLALTCQELMHISIQRVRIKRINDSSSAGMNDGIYKVFLLIHFEVTNVSSTHLKQRNKNKSSNSRRFLSNSAKLLPPATQLLLNLMNTTNIDQSAIRKNKTRRTKVSFFPTKLSLDQVYQRIGGAAHHQDDFLSLAHQQSPSSSSFNLTQFPKEILQQHIASYLKAKSLDSWRCSCKSMYTTLKQVVPGLSLQLYLHQIKSLQWMRLRETRLLTETDLLSHSVENHEDAHRAASGGASVKINDGESSTIHISQFNGQELLSTELLSRQMARGGLLCDDPGLGKTITVISLILQTLGLSTEMPTANTDPTNKKKNMAKLTPSDMLAPDLVLVDDNDDDDSMETDTQDDRIFKEYWKETIIPEYRYQYFNKLVNSLVKSSVEMDYFLKPVDAEKYPDYLDSIKLPMSIQSIRNKLNRSLYGDSFEAFQNDVQLVFDNAKTYNEVGSVVHNAAVKMEAIFALKIQEFKSQNIAQAKKAFAKASARPNSTVAALVETANKARMQQALVQSGATLLVVPSVLLEHWQDQLRLHVNLKYCTDKIPIVFQYTGTNSCALKMEEIVHQCKVQKTHCPMIFVDKSTTKQLPSAHFLSMFAIVITTNQRFTNEWKNGSLEDELKRQTSEYRFQDYSYGRDDGSEACCPLLKVHWLRMVVDEGHSMGRGKDNSAISFASWITAQRRWAMTGTPTRQTLAQSGLANILNLLQYLQHSFFSRRQDGDAVWQNLVARGWNRGQLSSFFRLVNLLSLLMVRHTKMDIEELPPPKYSTKILAMSGEEVTTYNTLVCAVQSNLLITSMEGRTSGKQDSLLHKSQAKHAKKALENVRLVCAGGTQVIPTLTQEYWKEFMEDFQNCHPPPHKVTEMKHYLTRAVTGQLSSCDCCSIALSTLLVFPCGHLVCTECVDHTCDTCIVCEKPFDIDLFQRLQPGMVYEWLHNVEEEAKQKKARQMKQGSSSPSNSTQRQNEAVILQAGGAGMLAPLDPSRPRRRTNKPGDGHTCEYCPKQANGQCTLCWKEHDECNLMSKSKSCEVCHRPAEDCPESETKSAYVVGKLIDLYQNHQKYEQQSRLSSPLRLHPGGLASTRNEKRPLKVIIFSQFRKVLNMTGDRLLKRFGSGCVAEYWGAFRRKELHKFIYEKNCFCMLLGKDGSEGLDLSFVTHIFFMEQVWDKSLEQQAVARAWRMGAKGSVEVETLVAKVSVEETMNRLEHQLGNDNESRYQDGFKVQRDGEGEKKSEYQRAKLQFLLKGLSLIANPYAMSYGSVKLQIPSATMPKRQESGTDDGEPSDEPPFKRRKREHQVRFA